MEKDFIDYYRLLEVHIFASPEAIKASYKRLSKKYHPDNEGDMTSFKRITEAYSILDDSNRRRDYLREWKDRMFSYNAYCKHPFGASCYDLAFQPVRETVHIYMFYIMNREYEKAYNMLSKDSRKRIFKRDFIKWQELVGEVHEILSFESTFESLEFSDTQGVQVVFQMKVKEQNMLLSRKEEEFFRRIVVYEEDSWLVHLQNISVRQVIKKYKQIILIHKRKQKRMNKKHIHSFQTKYLDVDSFLDNVEYEFLRYKRYGRKFALLSALVEEKSFRKQQKIIQVLARNVRNTDSFCLKGNQVFLVLLTEIDEDGLGVFADKLGEIFQEESIVSYTVCKALVNGDIISTKDMMNQVITSE